MERRNLGWVCSLLLGRLNSGPSNFKNIFFVFENRVDNRASNAFVFENAIFVSISFCLWLNQSVILFHCIGQHASFKIVSEISTVEISVSLLKLLLLKNEKRFWGGYLTLGFGISNIHSQGFQF